MLASGALGAAANFGAAFGIIVSFVQELQVHFEDSVIAKDPLLSDLYRLKTVNILHGSVPVGVTNAK